MSSDIGVDDAQAGSESISEVTAISEPHASDSGSISDSGSSSSSGEGDSGAGLRLDAAEPPPEPPAESPDEPFNDALVESPAAQSVEQQEENPAEEPPAEPLPEPPAESFESSEPPSPSDAATLVAEEAAAGNADAQLIARAMANGGLEGMLEERLGGSVSTEALDAAKRSLNLDVLSGIVPGETIEGTQENLANQAKIIKQTIENEAETAIASDAQRSQNEVSTGNRITTSDSSAFFDVDRFAEDNNLSIKHDSDLGAIWIKSDINPEALVRLEQNEGHLDVTDIFKRDLPSGAGSDLLAAGLGAGNIGSGDVFNISNIMNKETLASHESGVPAESSLLGKTVTRALQKMGLELGKVDYKTDNRGGLSLSVRVK